jgi:hypothetical protein
MGKKKRKITDKKMDKLNKIPLLFFYHRIVPPLTQGNGWGSTSP